MKPINQIIRYSAVAWLCFMGGSRSFATLASNCEWAVSPIKHQAVENGNNFVLHFNTAGLGIDTPTFLAEIRGFFENIQNPEYADIYTVKQTQESILLSAFPTQKPRIVGFFNRYWNGNGSLEEVEDLVAQLPSSSKKEFQSSQPYRFRTISKFQVSSDASGEKKIQDLEIPKFSQSYLNQADFRTRERHFPRASETFRKHQLIHKVLTEIFDLVNSAEKNQVEQIDVVVHQMAIFSHDGKPVTNSPEGVHQDGYDYIVSALVIDRQNIVGGESLVFDFDTSKSTPIFSHTLQPGEGIFQSDRHTNLWHVATPVQSQNEDFGYRTVLGFDITIKRGSSPLVVGHR